MSLCFYVLGEIDERCLRNFCPCLQFRLKGPPCVYSLPGAGKQKHKRPKNVDLLARWCAVRGLFISPWEWPGKMLNKLVIPGLISPWVWPGVDRGIGI